MTQPPIKYECLNYWLEYSCTDEYKQLLSGKRPFHIAYTIHCGLSDLQLGLFIPIILSVSTYWSFPYRRRTVSPPGRPHVSVLSNPPVWGLFPPGLVYWHSLLGTCDLSLLRLEFSPLISSYIPWKCILYIRYLFTVLYQGFCKWYCVELSKLSYPTMYCTGFSFLCHQHQMYVLCVFTGYQT